ncbi:MAG: diacylglycerol kinase family lipid kinase [Planctomycetes bacterium]|nr:diacylglycerol kinase family lipid kinase [Planctomycetota bacterium]
MNGSTSPRRLLLIANPISGGGRGRLLAPQLAAALRARGAEAEVHLTTSAGDATARAAAAGAEPWHALVAIGGDGTVNEVLNGMPDPTRPLGVLPVGTANVLALELGLPRRVEAAAAVLAAGHTRALAIGRAGDRRFLLFCGHGVDGAVVARLSEVRSGTLGKHKWLGPIWHTLRHWPDFHLRATLASGEVLDGLSSVLVTRVRNYGGVVQLPADVDCDSGLLHVLAFRQRSRSAWLWQGLRGLCRRMRAGPGLELRRTTSLRIDGDAPFQIDGDHGGRGPVAIDLLPVHARLLCPRPRP